MQRSLIVIPDVISDLGMEIDDSVHACVTEFMINTCDCTATENAAKDSLYRTLARAVAGIEMFVSGSSAEFYIKPMLSCIGDIDIMLSYSNEAIAIPYGQLPPAELLNKYRKIAVSNIIDTHNPGYVYLRAACIYEDGHCVEANTQNMAKFDPVSNVQFDCDFLSDICMTKWLENAMSMPSLFSGINCAMNQQGPAAKFTKTEDNTDMDFVISMYCPIWPTQAADWPTRYRDHGWPDQTTINLVVSNACDLVQAVHPSCKDDWERSASQWRLSLPPAEVATTNCWTPVRQTVCNLVSCRNEWEKRASHWRLSFSRAEVTLLNSWTPVQQIVYHMLRYVLKREVFSKTTNNSKTQFSNYHIKTSMLWAREQNPPRSWSAESSLVKICSWMLYKLSDCVEAKYCQHYFISSCNLLDYFDDNSSQTICKRLRSLSYEPVLLSWFVENYIRKSALYCPANVSMLFEDISSTDKLKKAVNAVVEWKLNTLPRERCDERYYREKIMSGYVGTIKTSTKHVPMIAKILQQFNQRLEYYFIAMVCLRVKQTVSMHSLSEELRKILPTLYIVPGNALEMLQDELSKACLHRILTSGQDSVCCVARVLLAALYYKSECFQIAANHCKHAINQRLCDHWCVFCITAAEQLPRIDQSVDSVAGLITIYQQLHQKAIHVTEQPEKENKPAFSSKLLAHYFNSKCAPVVDARRNYRYELCMSKRLLISDVLLFKTIEMQLCECTGPSVAADQNNDTDNNESSSTDTSLLAALLELVALERLIAYRQAMVRELHSEKFPLLNEFEVLHAYKCGSFQECLDMCRNYVNSMLRAACLNNQHFNTARPTLFGLLDDEILAFFGIIRLTYPLWYLYEVEYPEYESISLLTVSIYLMVQCQKKLRSDSFHEPLQLIRYIHDKLFPSHGKEYFLDRLILKLSYRSLKLYIFDSACKQHLN